MSNPPSGARRWDTGSARGIRAIAEPVPEAELDADGQLFVAMLLPEREESRECVVAPLENINSTVHERLIQPRKRTRQK